MSQCERLDFDPSPDDVQLHPENDKTIRECFGLAEGCLMASLICCYAGCPRQLAITVADLWCPGQWESIIQYNNVLPHPKWPQQIWCPKSPPYRVPQTRLDTPTDVCIIT